MARRTEDTNTADSEAGHENEFHAASEADPLLSQRQQHDHHSYDGTNGQSNDDPDKKPTDMASSGPELSKARAYFTIATLSVFTLFGSMTTGLLIISIPRIQEDLNMPEAFVLWPASIYSLVMGCLLLLSGSIADFVGDRIINLIGTFILGGSLIAAGLSQDAIQIIVFRGLQGVGASMSFPTAISMLSHAFPTGRLRSIGFAFLGLGQPLGFCLGLVLGGIFETYGGGWRTGFYVSGGVIMFLTFANIWLLPKPYAKMKKLSLRRLRHDIDWIGIWIASACLGLLSYILAIITDDASRLALPANAALLAITILLMPVFGFWMHYREKNNKRALIPNSLWKNAEFTSICIMVLFSWGVIESMDLFFSLFYQNVQHLGAVSASVRFLPSAIVGMVLNVFTGFLVYKFHMGWLVTFFSLLCVGSPLLMAVIQPEWPYWYDAFWASALGPLACDAIFTVANLVTTKVFPEDTQGLAGAVFNTIAQLGGSLGIAIMASVNSGAKQAIGNKPDNMSQEQYLLAGYRAVWWSDTALSILVCLVGAIGLRKLGRMEG